MWRDGPARSTFEKEHRNFSGVASRGSREHGGQSAKIASLLTERLGSESPKTPPLRSWHGPSCPLGHRRIRKALFVDNIPTRPQKHTIILFTGSMRSKSSPGGLSNRQRAKIAPILTWRTSAPPQSFTRGRCIRNCGRQELVPERTFCLELWFELELLHEVSLVAAESTYLGIHSAIGSSA